MHQLYAVFFFNERLLRVRREPKTLRTAMLLWRANVLPTRLGSPTVSFKIRPVVEPTS
jgi:hypothetical protein